MQTNEGNYTYETGTSLAAQGAFMVQKDGTLQFAPPQWVDQANPVVTLKEDPRTVARAQAVEYRNQVTQLEKIGRRINRNGHAPSAKQPAQEMKKTSNLGTKNSLHSTTQPTMRNFTQTTSRKPTRNFGALLKTALLIAEIALDLKTGGAAGAVAALVAAPRAGMAGPKTKTIGLAAKPAMLAGPKVKAINPKDDMAMVLVECLKPVTRLKPVAGADEVRPVTVMKKRPKWVAKPRYLALTA